jgi:hypothetical protein
VVRFLAAEAELSQFLDIGTGIPSPGGTHEVAQEVRPGSRIVYVDNDPVVLAYARALLVGHEDGTTDYIDADLRHPESILEQAAQTKLHPAGRSPADRHPARDQRRRRPLPDRGHADGRGAAGQLPRDIARATDLLSPAERASLGRIPREKSHEQYTTRSQAEFARFFDGLELAEPGLVRPGDWRPDPRDLASEDIALWAGMGYKP